MVGSVAGEIVADEPEGRLDLLDDLDQLLGRHPQIVVADDHPVDERVHHRAMDLVDRLEGSDEAGEVDRLLVERWPSVLEMSPALGGPDPPRPPRDARHQGADGVRDESHGVPQEWRAG
jgi:hypothetical protein